MRRVFWRFGTAALVVLFASETLAVEESQPESFSAARNSSDHGLALVTDETSALPDEPPNADLPATALASTPLDEESLFTVHGQTTLVTDYHGRFPAPYSGTHSLLPFHEAATSQTSTLFLGAKLWDGCELYFNPEVAGGRGLSGVSGIAGFPNGEITRVGKPEPTPYIARFFVSYTVGLGGDPEKIDDGPNAIKGYQDSNRVSFSVGKLASTDLIDNNAFNHDPRTQFLNWALLYNGAWDYPADVRGYTYGGVVTWNVAEYALRYGLFAEPAEANGAVLDPNFSHAHGHAWEIEREYKRDELTGHLRLLAFLNSAHMGDYHQATVDPAAQLDITKTRRYRNKYGFGLSWDHELSETLGVFSRLGWNDGHTESWAFTEIDQTMTFGARVKGTRWHREYDEVGLATAVNGISKPHRDYLAAGGLGFILGDGQLRYGLESVLESYYRYQISPFIQLTADSQFIWNPGFNQDRGPVFVQGLRVHAEF
jgi:high affinity Mn2+ porin